MNTRQTANEMMEMLKEYETYLERLNLITANEIDLANDKHLNDWLSVHNTINLIKDELKAYTKSNAIEIDLV